MIALHTVDSRPMVLSERRDHRESIAEVERQNHSYSNNVTVYIETRKGWIRGCARKEHKFRPLAFHNGSEAR